MTELPIVRGGDPILTADEFHKTKIGKENLTWGEIMCLFAKYHCENQAKAIEEEMKQIWLNSTNTPIITWEHLKDSYPLYYKIIPI